LAENRIMRPLRLGSPKLGIVEEPRADLDREAVEAGDIGGLHIDLAIGVGISIDRIGGITTPPSASAAKAALDHVDSVQVSETARRSSASVRMRMSWP
jgi:hypothetical protein